MRKSNLSRIVAVLHTLTADQLKTVTAELVALKANSGATSIIEARSGEAASCPHCRSQLIYRHGHANGLQRYRCRECRRTFNALSGTPLSWLHKREKWLAQSAHCRMDGRCEMSPRNSVSTSERHTAGVIASLRFLRQYSHTLWSVLLKRMKRCFCCRSKGSERCHAKPENGAAKPPSAVSLTSRFLF